MRGKIANGFHGSLSEEREERTDERVECEERNQSVRQNTMNFLEYTATYARMTCGAG